MRVWMGLFMILLGLAVGCKANENRKQIQRDLKGGAQDFTGRNAALGELLKTSKGSSTKDTARCLNLVAVIEKVATGNDSLAIYSSDVDLGSFGSVAGNKNACLNFKSDVKEHELSQILFHPTMQTYRPQLNFVKASALVSELKPFLNQVSQSSCESAIVNGVKYKILCAQSPRMLVLQPEQVSLSTLVYDVDLARNALTITTFHPYGGSEICGRNLRGLTSKETVTVTWGSQYTLQSRFDAAVRKTLKMPAADAKNGGALNAPSLITMMQEAQKATPLECPKN